MIKYTLKCGEGHSFESWFASAGAFDTLVAGGHLTCLVCGSREVSKAIMAPSVSKARAQAGSPGQSGTGPQDKATALAELRRNIEEKATYVGSDFARQARSMHLGDAPEKPIWGEANLKEAKSLIEDGVPVAPLPFVTTRKAN